jgi:hypothetical protein
MSTTTSSDELVDIRDVKVDVNLPKMERIIEYIRQIKNPYRFKCGEFIVSVKYANNGVSLEDCLERLVGVRPASGPVA